MARWARESAVRREDQFTAAPDFIDEHDSRHLPMWGRLGAAWHGMTPRRRVFLAASIAALSMAGGLGLFTALDSLGGEVGTQPHASGPLAAEDGADGIGPGLADGVPSLAPEAANATAPAPALPSAPPGP